MRLLDNLDIEVIVASKKYEVRLNHRIIVINIVIIM